MIDLDLLAQLAPPHGEGTVALRTALFLDLITELRATRNCLVQNVLEPSDSTTLTAEDVRDLAIIRQACEANE